MLKPHQSPTELPLREQVETVTLSGPLRFCLAFGGAEPTGGVRTDRSKPPSLLGLPKWIIKGMVLYHQLNESN